MLTASKIKVRYIRKFNGLAKRTIKNIRVNSCNSWRKIES